MLGKKKITQYRFGHMMKILDELWPDKILAVLEGGYFSGSYTECAAMAVRGLRVCIYEYFHMSINFK